MTVNEAIEHLTALKEKGYGDVTVRCYTEGGKRPIQADHDRTSPTRGQSVRIPTDLRNLGRSLLTKSPPEPAFRRFG